MKERRLKYFNRKQKLNIKEKQKQKLWKMKDYKHEKQYI